MKAFLLRLSIFICLMVLTIYENHLQITISIFIFTFALMIFFFLSHYRTYVYLYYTLTILIIFHGYLIQESFYTSIFLLLFSIIASSRFKDNTFIIYLAFNSLALSLLILYYENYFIKNSLLMLFILFILCRVNLLEQKQRDQRHMYDRLLIEYRKLKRLHALNERETRLEERTRIARELHDSVGHRLTALIMKLEMLSIQQSNSVFSKLKTMADDSLQETREAVQALQVTDTEGIASVVQLIRKLEAESHLLIDFNLKQGVLTIPLSSEESVVLYRVIQEALTNVMRHSPFKTVEITLAKSPVDSLEFTIKNKVEHAQPLQLGFGLKTMKNRVAGVGGKINVYQTNDKFVIKGVISNK